MKTTLFAVFCFFSLPLFGQLPVLLDEQFNQPNSLWYWSDIDNENYLRKIRNNVLYQEQRGSNVYWTLHASNIDPTKDFAIETKFKAIEPMNNGMFYFILQGNDELYLYFGINTEQKTYWIGSGQNSTWTIFHKATADNGFPTNESIQTGLNDNVLRIEVIDGTMRFMVNGSLLESINFKEKAPPLATAIHYLGLATDAPMKTETDYFKIYQDKNINLLTTATFDIVKKRLGPEVNTPYIEKWPVVSPDGKTLYFARNVNANNIDEPPADDIFYSEATSDSTWSKALPMPKPLNNDSYNTVMSVTPDNNLLFLIHQYNRDGSFKAPGFSTSSRTANGWSMPRDVPMKNYYNDARTNEFYLSSDQKIMILGVERKDTHGGNDLYVSKLQSDGSYSEPQNMGAVLNSLGDEVAPFLAADEHALYFSSNGHPGYGGYDIFISRRLDDTWLNWSKPQNMGPQINTVAWELYFTIPASGAFAYMAIAENDNLDLYRVNLPRVFRPEPVVIVSGKVIDTKTKKPLEASIRYSDLLSTESPGRATSNPGDGRFKIALPAKRNYAFLAQKEGYYATSENLDLSNLKEYEEITKDLYLTPIEAGQVIRLNNIFFDFNKSELKKESFPELTRLIELMKTNSKLVIEVGGHTDNVGDDAYNLKLSQSRADAVVRYLTSNGISAVRVTAKGYGESKPVSVNTTDEGRSTNRRVEFTIVKE